MSKHPHASAREWISCDCFVRGDRACRIDAQKRRSARTWIIVERFSDRRFLEEIVFAQGFRLVST